MLAATVRRRGREKWSQAPRAPEDVEAALGTTESGVTRHENAQVSEALLRTTATHTRVRVHETFLDVAPCGGASQVAEPPWCIRRAGFVAELAASSECPKVSLCKRHICKLQLSMMHRCSAREHGCCNLIRVLLRLRRIARNDGVTASQELCG